MVQYRILGLEPVVAFGSHRMNASWSCPGLLCMMRGLEDRYGQLENQQSRPYVPLEGDHHHNYNGSETCSDDSDHETLLWNCDLRIANHGHGLGPLNEQGLDQNWNHVDHHCRRRGFDCRCSLDLT